MVALECQWRADLERVAAATGRADKNALVAHGVDDVLCPYGVGFRRSRLDDFDADRQADSTDFTDQGRFGGDVTQPSEEVLPYPPGALDYPLVVHDLQHCERSSHRDRVAGEGAEELVIG